MLITDSNDAAGKCWKILSIELAKHQTLQLVIITLNFVSYHFGIEELIIEEPDIDSNGRAARVSISQVLSFLNHDLGEPTSLVKSDINVV